MFSKKSKVAAVYKALTNEFRDLIRFGFVSSDQEELTKQFNITKYPTVMVLKSYDVDTKQVLDQEEEIIYKKEEFKFDELKKFIRPYTRDEPKEAKEEKKIEDDKVKK